MVAPVALSLSGDSGIFIVIIIFILFRSYRGLTGTKYSPRALYFTPAIYLVLVVFVLFTYTEYTIIDDIAILIAIIVGAAAGLTLGGGVKFYEQNGSTYYKRVPLIVIIWLAALVFRLACYIFFPTIVTLNLAADILLGFTAGLLIGEAININRKYANHKLTIKKEKQ